MSMSSHEFDFSGISYGKVGFIPLQKTREFHLLQQSCSLLQYDNRTTKVPVFFIKQ